MTQLPCNPPELRTLFLFEKLTDHQLEQLCEKGHVELIEPGPVFAEGEIATCFYVLIEGELVLSKLSGGEEIEFSRTSQRGVYSGAWQSYLGDRAPQTYTASMRVTAPSRFFVLDADRFGQLMREWFPMAVHLLEGLFFGNQNAKQVVDQRERLLALGSLSAGLTHELNNPAAAAVRATASLRDRVSHMRQKLSVIASGVYDRQALATLIRLQEETAELVAKAPTLTPLEASDREDELGDWFDDHGVSGGWDLAPTFVQAGLDVPWLERIVASVDDESMVESAIRWLNYTIETELLMNEIADSTARVSTLVNAAKQYSQMDRAPYQRVDLRELLDSSLVMLGRKIGDSVTVVKEYDPTLPQIPAYAAELNQVWTNLIDNAVAAMDGRGTLTVRTRRDGDMALIEIGDTGPGVPEEIRSRIFEPFFTTKPVGEGTGLGLDISWRIVVKKHRGDLRVESEPGDTRFQVRIPIEPEVAAAEGASDG
ncbi:ATP-binding protein [Rhodococcus opacus]|uniref:histidine kinase n=2 Tax=Rhodococcus opacus TaxID=37919 RepID=A0AAX3YEK4_RHOOP|nr:MULTISPECIES: ATP-binding protein [Rhodococcus]ELB93803.1 sensor kinase, two-component system [Rhodococcus wratislaviensis IFP 2016]EKT80138.1 sensor kinase, two-component system [Rhodococcus opacus M213]MBA8957844.1 signal transduction histidine kinase [Rhodococcus opacus]MBP2203409.1 signal transduction histidine kinase [Rhodococcus opacus]MCZ4584138.1 ATP-binding protein [Rhodococcus opacus]